MDMEEIRDLEIIRELLETRQYTNLRQKVAEMNTADVAAILEEIDDEDNIGELMAALSSIINEIFGDNVSVHIIVE